jgi:hypothetical protein
MINGGKDHKLCFEKLSTNMLRWIEEEYEKLKLKTIFIMLCNIYLCWVGQSKMAWV